VLPAAAGISSNVLRDQAGWAEFPAERYLTFRLSMDNEALAGEHGVPDDGQIAARRALAYEELAGRLREEPGVTHVTHGDRLPTMGPEWVAVEMEQDGAPPARLHGNYEGGFAMAAVGAGYHDAFGAKIVAGRGLQAADAGAPNRPIVVNEAFMRVVGRNPVGARVRTLQRGSERELGPWHEIVGVVTDLPMLFPADWGEAAYRSMRNIPPAWSLSDERAGRAAAGRHCGVSQFDPVGHRDGPDGAGFASRPCSAYAMGEPIHQVMSFWSTTPAFRCP